MEINITLCFQAANFFLAYILLDKLLMSPAVAYLEKENREKEELAKELEHSKMLLQNKTEFLAMQWQECKNYIRMQGVLEKIVPINYESVRSISYCSLSQEHIELLSVELACALVKKVSKESSSL